MQASIALQCATLHGPPCTDFCCTPPHAKFGYTSSHTLILIDNEQVGGGGKAKSMFEFADDSMCLACNQNRLTFEPPSLYCTCCGQRIKRNQVCINPCSGGILFKFQLSGWLPLY